MPTAAVCRARGVVGCGGAGARGGPRGFVPIVRLVLRPPLCLEAFAAGSVDQGLTSPIAPRRSLPSRPGRSLPIIGPSTTEQHRAPAARNADPFEATRLRYSDGSTWTEHVAPVGPTPPTTAASQPAVDLTANRPGAAARAKALEVRRAAPVRSQVARVLGVHTGFVASRGPVS